ncbi:MAG: hypothetical protein JNM84_02900 [Planctomycetes bacterium]|nr:hypothetical protein [Planctomycetota bacterium]
MQDAILEALAEIGDATYRQKPELLPSEIQQRLRQVPPRALRLGAPKRIDLAQGAALPLLYLSGETETLLELVPPPDNTALCAVDLEEGTATVEPAFPVDPRKTDAPEAPRAKPQPFPALETPAPPPPSEDPDDPPPFPERAHAVGQVWLDACALGVVEARAGRFALRVQCFDRASNVVRVELRQGEQALPPTPGFPADLARELELATRREEELSLPPRRFARSDSTPKLAGAGVALAFAPKLRSGEKRFEVHAALQLVLPPGAIVDPRRRAKPDQSAEIPAQDLPAAVVRAYVAIATLDVPRPRLVEVLIPVRAPKTLAAGAPVELAFTLDLYDAIGGALPAGTYFLALIAGEHMSAPQRLDVGSK